MAPEHLRSEVDRARRKPLRRDVGGGRALRLEVGEVLGGGAGSFAARLPQGAVPGERAAGAVLLVEEPLDELLAPRRGDRDVDNSGPLEVRTWIERAAFPHPGDGSDPLGRDPEPGPRGGVEHVTAELLAPRLPGRAGTT